MSLLIGFLTFILVVNCLFLILLVLVQLPKKEAGAGLAFGAGAVDTLIGAGSGNALTKMTKYAAGSFMAMALILAVLNAQRHEGSSKTIQAELAKKASALPAALPQAISSPASGALTNNLLPTNVLSQPAAATAPAVAPAAAPLQLQPAATPTAPAVNPPAAPESKAP